MWNIPNFQIWHLFHICKHWACHTTPGFGSHQFYHLPSFPSPPCSRHLLRVLAPISRSWLRFPLSLCPENPSPHNCMSSYFSVQRALTIGHSGLPFHFVFFPALPWLHFKLSIHQSIYSFTHLSTYPLTYTPYKCAGTGLRITTVWSRAEWRLVQCSGTLEFCQLVGKAKPTPPKISLRSSLLASKLSIRKSVNTL